jgi:hypothetical protein
VFNCEGEEGMAASEAYLSEDGVCEQYPTFTPRTLQRWRAIGDGPPFVRAGKRRILYRVADIETWLRDRTYRHRAEELARAAGEAAR